MVYELNEYHINLSEEELLNDIVIIAKKLNKNTLTRSEYQLSGKYYPSTFTKRFGSWKNACIKAGLNLDKKQNNSEISTEDLLEDMKRVSGIINKQTITVIEYNENGKYNATTIINKFKSWNNALSNAGLKISVEKNIQDEYLFEDIEQLWRRLGRQPTSSDIKNGLSKYSLNTYSRRFGGWRGSLIAFLEYVSSDIDIKDKETIKEVDSVIYIKTNEKVTNHATSRDINLRLRFQVLKRDNFKCIICGASPSTDPTVELHVDHIFPWSKGGETVIGNLQTLCSKCNLGKSNIV